MQIPSPNVTRPASSPATSALTGSDPMARFVRAPGAPQPTGGAGGPQQSTTASITAPLLARETLRALIAAQVDQNDRGAFCKELLTQLDSNKDSRLSRAEIDQAMANGPPGMRPVATVLKAVLTDASHAGAQDLSLGDIETHVMSLDLHKDQIPLSTADVDAAAGSMDQNGDQSLSDDEVRAALAAAGSGVRPNGMNLDLVARTIASLDANGDKILSLDEIHQALGLSGGRDGADVP